MEWTSTMTTLKCLSSSSEQGLNQHSGDNHGNSNLWSTHYLSPYLLGWTSRIHQAEVERRHSEKQLHSGERKGQPWPSNVEQSKQ